MASTARIDELRKKFDENPRRYFAPLANEFRKSGDIEQAIMICEEFLPQQPGHMSGHIVYGQALYEVGRMPESRTVFETALGLDPENLIALRHLGDIAQGQADLATARTFYQRVLDADPRNDEIQALIDGIPAGTPAPDAMEIIAEDEFDLAGPMSAPTTEVVAVGVPTDIEKEEPALEAAEDRGEAHPLGIPVIPPPAPTPPPLPTTELSGGVSPRGFDASPERDTNAVAAHGPADGLESTSFTPPKEKIAGAEDLDDSLDSGVPSFEAPTQVIPTIDGLQGIGDVLPPPRDEDVDTEEFAAAERPVLDEGSGLAGASRDAASEFEARADSDAPAEEDAPMELSAAVLAAETELIDAGETPEPEPAVAPDDEPEFAPTASAPFDTETMAELYVAQGLHAQALGVYARLLAANPSDVRLQGLVASLTPAHGGRQSEPTVREFFARMASRRPLARGAASGPPAEDDFAPAGALRSAPSDVAPAIERTAAMRTPTGSIDALFNHRSPGTSEDSAASALAQAFGATADAEPFIVGRPARTASAELSLDSVFRDTPARPPRTSQSFSFDQFFTPGANNAGTADRPADMRASRTSSEVPVQGEPPAERSADDVQQFNSWLQGLKPR